MSGAVPAPTELVVLAVRAGLAVSVLMLVVGLAGSGTGAAAAAADGPQGSPALRPDAVAAASDPFSLVPPADTRCDGSGADGWRWHTFIVEAGRDLSTLEFGPTGPGGDYDAADGQITASLISSGRGVWAQPPAEQPNGLVNPGGLAGLALDPSDYTLGDGRYLIGFACTDETSATRQWWSLEVTVQVSAAPFLTASPDAGGPADSTTATTITTAGAGTASADLASSTTVVAAAGESGDAPTGGSPGVAASTPAAPAPATTSVSWSPLAALVGTSRALPVGAWAALVVVLARISYLLARPVRNRPPLTP